MASSNRLAKIDSYRRAYQTLAAALDRYPKAMWHYKPAADQWSIHEIVVHITDSEANSYIRCRRFIAEPGSTLMAYDENVWARALDYHQQDTEGNLALFQWLRKQSYDLVKELPEEVWQNQAYHPENGLMTLDDWLDIYERHIPEHVEQMERVYQQWRRQEGAA